MWSRINLREKKECPLNGNCRQKCVIYSATVEAESGKETYIGLTENEFKVRHANHKQSFRNENLKHSTELSKHIWALKESNTTYELKWEIVGRASPYSNRTKKCNLCLLEKYYILLHRDKASLNSRSELVSTCRHSRKFLLNSI